MSRSTSEYEMGSYQSRLGSLERASSHCSTLHTTRIFLGAVYAIMPELPGIILSGKISEKPKEVIEIFERIAENIELISLLFILWLVLITAITTFFKAWWIKLCNNALECMANLRSAFQHAKSRFLPLFVYELIFAIITAVAFYPIINLAAEIFENFETIGKETEMIVYYGISFLLWTVLLAILLVTLSFLFVFVPYAIVIDGEGTISGIKKGIKVLRRNIADTVIMWLLVGLANMAVQIPYYVLKTSWSLGDNNWLDSCSGSWLGCSYAGHHLLVG